MNEKNIFCLSRHLLPTIALDPAQQNCKCLHIRNHQYTEFPEIFGAVGPLEENLDFSSPLGFDVQTDSEHKTSKIKLY